MTSVCKCSLTYTSKCIRKNHLIETKRWSIIVPCTANDFATIIANLKAGKITREEAITKLRGMVRMVQEDDEFALFDAKTVGIDDCIQMGEMKPLICLLQTAIPNLGTGEK